VHRLTGLNLAMLIVLMGAAGGAAMQPADSKEQILSLMRKVCDWQLAQLPTEKVAASDTDVNWVRAVFFDGDMALYRATLDNRYLDPMLKVGAENKWLPDPTRTRNADGQAISQLYIELYFVKKDPAMIRGTAVRWDRNMVRPMLGHIDWWWCDALYMAPPVLAGLSAATGDKKYLDFMDKQYTDSIDYLYDSAEHLAFRDPSFFSEKEKNGKKAFWSRGNGWLMAGDVRVLQYMPADYPSRWKYVQLLKEMSQRVAGLQQPDGFWRMSLLDPESWPGGESSGTGLFCYAMAWGVNAGILPAEEYRPVIDKAWKALAGSVEPSGKLDWVQPTGSKPGPLKKEDTAEYGSGAFLLAGSEVLKLNALPSGSRLNN
jgi:unsaturated rhamnogalacturonyl hydrolase